MTETEKKKGTLYVVATPIGNLEDITMRALRTLQEVDLIAAEDTRHTRKLLSHFGINKPLISYYKEKEAGRSDTIVAELLGGRQIALVSDAGTPGISDPGAMLVDKCRQNGIDVTAVPGPSALTAALSISGLSYSAFTFLGFLPSKQSQRKKMLSSLVQLENLLVFYESPRRIVQTLVDCYEILGERRIVVARELTKMHEEILHGNLSFVLDSLRQKSIVKGEFVVLICANDVSLPALAENLPDLLLWYKNQSGLSMKDSVKKISTDLNLSRSLVYKEALTIWKS
ncbi:MAG: 16S rRNA (cytidine(1402)-2'-O)-methyltransferase [Desulfobulbaceae bacterium DB1]|nr:MAG: 16S rRNA (cytidine(1402)-2'-O)-methyltransferase [Desulfobulbaceae bacterium DB1]